MVLIRKSGTATDLPLILILSVYTDFSPLEFGKIQNFYPKIWQNPGFFLGMQNGFLYIFYIRTDFSPKILIFFVIYTDFVLSQSGRSAATTIMLSAPTD